MAYDGPVTLYSAGNAANGDLDITGDHIYTTNLTLTSSGGGGGGGSAPPVITAVKNAASLKSGIAQNTFVEIDGTGLSGTNPGRIWSTAAGDFKGTALPTSLDGASVTINNKPAFVYYVSTTQLDVLSPVDTSSGPVNVQVTFNGQTSNTMSTAMAAVSPS